MSWASIEDNNRDRQNDRDVRMQASRSRSENRYWDHVRGQWIEASNDNEVQEPKSA